MKELIYRNNELKLKFNSSITFFKKDILFTISLTLAILSCFLHTPKLEYIDFKVLISLFNLMLAVKAFEELKLLDQLAILILNKCHTSRKVSGILILLSFISSMFVTNDVALLTFVPLTLIIGKKAEINILETVILQTIAANLGSSLTPMGNPQNLFIFSHFDVRPQQFFSTILLLAIMGTLSLAYLILRFKSKELKVELAIAPMKNRKKAGIWVIVFFLIIASIFGLLSYKLVLIIVLVTACILDFHLLKKLDYLLLITFVCFFIFVGNISNIDIVHSLASESLKNSTSVYFSSIFLSQFISNVPATILLSNFSKNWQPLLIGVNIGGLGTIIASLASVISYRIVNMKKPKESKIYLVKFSLYNFSFLAFLTIIQYILLKVLNLM
jgi:Na+/H+ antiporter NhaD/arsenite permease-like protein